MKGQKDRVDMRVGIVGSVAWCTFGSTGTTRRKVGWAVEQLFVEPGMTGNGHFREALDLLHHVDLQYDVQGFLGRDTSLMFNTFLDQCVKDRGCL